MDALGSQGEGVGRSFMEVFAISTFSCVSGLLGRCLCLPRLFRGGVFPSEEDVSDDGVRRGYLRVIVSSLSLDDAVCVESDECEDSDGEPLVCLLCLLRRPLKGLRG